MESSAQSKWFWSGIKAQINAHNLGFHSILDVKYLSKANIGNFQYIQENFDEVGVPVPSIVFSVD